MSSDAAPTAVRTLYVEDDDVVRELTIEFLEEAGLAITGAGTAAEATALFESALRAEPFELLISDIGLPDLPGMELARRLAAQAPDLRIVFASGYPMPRRPDGWNGRAAALDKPIDLAELAAVLGELGFAPPGPPSSSA